MTNETTDEWQPITDPLELFHLKVTGWEIESREDGDWWEKWPGERWSVHWEFRVRPPQPKTHMAKLLSWVDSNGWVHRSLEGSPAAAAALKARWPRIPGEDKEVEVQDVQ